MLCGNGAPTPPPPDPNVPCCYASAIDPDDCTCWTPVHDREQDDPAGYTTLEARTTPCRDCAYRPDTPETDDDLPGATTPFWCHQGMRKVVAYRHPAVDLPHAPPVEGDHYDPPITGGIPYRADGRKAQLCAGWLAQHATTVDTRPLDS